VWEGEGEEGRSVRGEERERTRFGHGPWSFPAHRKREGEESQETGRREGERRAEDRVPKRAAPEHGKGAREQER